MKARLTLVVLLANVALLVASDESVRDTGGEPEPACEDLALDDATFTTDDDGVLLLAVAGVDGTEITRVQGQIEVPCAAVVELGSQVVEVYRMDDADTGEPVFLFDEQLFRPAEGLSITITACPAAEVVVQLRLVEACGGPLAVVLEQR